jgi:hypothetical protein
MSRHPSGYSSRHASGQSSEHPAMTSAARDLKPMPSADPLPKPPVIVRRMRSVVALAPNRPGGAVNSARTSSGTSPSNGTRRATPSETSKPGATEVTPLCNEFSYDDAGYLAWVETHPHGFVLNQPRAGRSTTPTVHRVGCAAVAGRVDTGESMTVTAIKVCGPSAEVLGAWSVARGTGCPTACRRCHP